MIVDMKPGNPFTTTELDFDAVCRTVREAVEPARLHAVSLHDENGEVLWLTEGSMGPDEHNAVREAFEAFSRDSGPGVVHYDLGDSRSAVLFRAVNARGTLVGALMLLLDTRVIKQDAKGPARLMNPTLQRALNAFIGMRAAAPVPPRAPATLDAPARPATSLPPGVTPHIDRLHAALRRSPIALHVQRLVPLAQGSPLKRYEVLLRSKSDDAPNAAPHAMLKAAVEHGLGSMIDRRVVTELIGWLVHHPDAWKTKAVMFSVNLTRTALLDDHFIKFIDLCLAKSLLPKAMIGFEFDVATAIALGDKVGGVAAALHRLGCPIVLDDFGMRTECFDLLRLPAVRYVKLGSEITAKMRTDKLSQAAITAVVQMARVMGMHTVAKRTETAAEQEWLTALGVDFIQSNALSPPVSINSLSREPASRRPAP